MRIVARKGEPRVTTCRRLYRSMAKELHGHTRPLRCISDTPRASMNVSRSRSGPVAQLGARLNGIQEVTGSIPVRSTIISFLLDASLTASQRKGFGGGPRRRCERARRKISTRQPCSCRRPGSARVCSSTASAKVRAPRCGIPPIRILERETMLEQSGREQRGGSSE